MKLFIKKLLIMINLGILFMIPVLVGEVKSKDIISRASVMIQKSLKTIKGDLIIQNTTPSGTLIIKYKTRKFIVHGRSMTGKILDKTHEEEGPSYVGFLLTMYLQPDNYINQAITPQVLKEPYFKTYLNLTGIKNNRKQFFWNLKYGSRTDPKLLEKIRKTISQFSSEF